MFGKVRMRRKHAKQRRAEGGREAECTFGGHVWSVEVVRVPFCSFPPLVHTPLLRGHQSADLLVFVRVLLPTPIVAGKPLLHGCALGVVLV